MKLNALLLCLTFLNCFSAINAQKIDFLKLEEKELPNGNIGVYGINVGHCPLTATVEFPVLKNMKVDKKIPYIVVIPAKADNFLIMTISTVDKPKGNSLEYRYGFTYAMGDAINAKHDDDHIYLLPYTGGQSYTIGQGYNGKFSHHGMNCLDFNMEVGTKVCAARAGVVVKVKEDSNKGCKSSKCKGQANYIMILHEDGTLARYIHLKYKGSKVKEGDKVMAGQHIGYSGNTGWSSGPHLHFEVNQPTVASGLTVATKFKTGKGQPGYLKEGERYTSVH